MMALMLDGLLVGGGVNSAQGSGRDDIASKHDDRVTTALAGSDCKRLEFYPRRPFNLDKVVARVLMDGAPVSWNVLPCPATPGVLIDEIPWPESSLCIGQTQSSPWL